MCSTVRTCNFWPSSSSCECVYIGMVCKARKKIAKAKSVSNHAMKINSISRLCLLLCLMKTLFFVVMAS